MQGFEPKWAISLKNIAFPNPLFLIDMSCFIGYFLFFRDDYLRKAALPIEHTGRPFIVDGIISSPAASLVLYPVISISSLALILYSQSTDIDISPPKNCFFIFSRLYRSSPIFNYVKGQNRFLRSYPAGRIFPRNPY